MSARIEWNQDVPEAVRKEVEPLLGRYHGLIPTWCILRVLYSREEGESPAEMRVHAEYRTAQLVIYPDFLPADRELRAEWVLHELLHIPTMGMKRAFHDVLEAVDLETEQPALYRWAVEAMRKANEAATTDLTESLRRMGVVSS